MKFTPVNVANYLRGQGIPIAKFAKENHVFVKRSGVHVTHIGNRIIFEWKDWEDKGNRLEGEQIVRRALQAIGLDATERKPGNGMYVIHTLDSTKKQKNPYRPDWADDIENYDRWVASDGTVLLYHATTKEKAEKILKEGVLRTAPGAPDRYGVYFSSSPTVANDYGDGTLVPIRARVRDIELEDMFPNGRYDFMVRTRQGVYRPVAVGQKALRKR